MSGRGRCRGRARRSVRRSLTGRRERRGRRRTDSTSTRHDDVNNESAFDLEREKKQKQKTKWKKRKGVTNKCFCARQKTDKVNQMTKRQMYERANEISLSVMILVTVVNK